MQSSNCKLQIASYKLLIANCKLQIANYKLQIVNCKLQKAKQQIFLPTIHLAFTIPLTWGRSKMQMQAKKGWVIRFQAKFTEDEIFAQPQRLLCKMTHGQDCVAWALLSKIALSYFAIQTWCHHNMQTIMHYLHLLPSLQINKWGGGHTKMEPTFRILIFIYWEMVCNRKNVDNQLHIS